MGAERLIVMDLSLNFKEVCSYNTPFNASVEQAIDGEYTLPDYCPDIKKILKCSITPYIHNVNPQGNSVTLDGTACICILYLSGDKKEIRGYEIASSFSKNIDLKTDTTSCAFECIPKCEYVNCRAVNERKLDIHGALSIKINCTSKEKSNTVSNIECDDIQLRKNCIEYSELTSNADKLIILNEEIALDETNGSILNIIQSRANVTNEEYKLVTDKIVYKANFNIKFTYLNEDGVYETVNCSIPISQIIEAEGITENAMCYGKSKVCGLELKPYTDRNGNCMSVLMNAKIMVSIKSWNNCNVETVTDAYSTDCELDMSDKQVRLMRTADNINYTEICRQAHSFDDGIKDIICVNYGNPQVSAAYEYGNINLSGSIPVCILYINSNGDCCCVDKLIDITTSLSSADEYNDFDINSYIENETYSLNSENSIEFRCDCRMSILPRKIQNIKLLTDITKDATRQKNNENRPAMTLYYAKSGESIWDIARRYNSKADEIMKQNGLTNDVLQSNKMIIIPATM